MGEGVLHNCAQQKNPEKWNGGEKAYPDVSAFSAGVPTTAPALNELFTALPKLFK